MEKLTAKATPINENQYRLFLPNKLLHHPRSGIVRVTCDKTNEVLFEEPVRLMHINNWKGSIFRWDRKQLRYHLKCILNDFDLLMSIDNETHHIDSAQLLYQNPSSPSGYSEVYFETLEEFKAMPHCNIAFYDSVESSSLPAYEADWAEVSSSASLSC